MRSLLVGVLLVLVLGTAGAARAGDVGALSVDGVVALPVGDLDGVTAGQGYGVRFSMLPGHEAFFFTIGGFFTIGQGSCCKEMRDLYDLGFDLGLKPESPRLKALVPFAALGLDVLNVSTRYADGSSLHGTTLGIHVRAGIMGALGARWFYQASAAYLGAVVPGTGDPLGGLVVQFGLGVRLPM
jgi:hypothetical protein